MFRTPDKTCVSRDVCGDVSDKVRAEYGTELLTRLATDLTAGFGRGVSRQGLQKMRLYFPAREICPTPSSKFEARVRLPAGLLESVAEICPTVSGELPIFPTPSAEFSSHVSSAFPLTSSRYVQLMAVEKPHPRGFYEAEAIRPGWSVRQLESFLLELGAGFTFVARQKRIRVGSEWHRIDLLLFHRRLNCQVVIDLKLGEFTHADMRVIKVIDGQLIGIIDGQSGVRGFAGA